MKLKGKNALITGASRGIGKGCAIEMAREGANVAINYYSHADEAEAVAEEARRFGVKAMILQGDVSDRLRVEEMVAQTAREFGSLDLFISNAVYSDRQPMIEADLKGFERTINVGMWGAFYGTRAAAIQMVKQGKGGCIVVVSSPHAVLAIPTSMAYNMAKAAIDHMARTAAIELAEHRIRVNIIHPGWIDEIGKAAVYICSDDADYMTGSTLTIDGGVSLPWWSNRAEGQP
jgi:glucose 1-dehydrogenase